jgi:glutaredoxin
MKPMIKYTLSLALLTISALPAWAQQYKVVGPDGSVTYTDRPPVEANFRVTAMGRNATPTTVTADNSLPAELRQAVQRYPVTLYSALDCGPCDNARRLLQQRGIPYSERRIATEEDALALERAVGGRTLPAMNVGSQQARGFSETDWVAFLDAAGYPRESKLPRNWPVPAPVPMVERAAVAPARAAAPAPADAPPVPPQPGAIRF